MYAFNKRFRATTFKGLPMMTMLLVALGLVLGAFGLGAIIMIKKVMLAFFLFFGTGTAFFYAIDVYRNKDRVRLLSSLTTGRREIKAKPMEI
jgi:hypothetical protein